MFDFALQIPNFTYPDTPPTELFERVSAVAQTAEESGFGAVFVMDHFYQLPLLGPPDHEMFEAYTLLGALAARTDRVLLGTLVTGVTYRNPAVLAKIVTTLDVVSRGRALLGIGGAWFDTEHEALGVDFPPTPERLQRLEEAIEICRAMFREERPTFEGRHYRTKDVINSPAPVREGGPPIMVGGSGEQVTFRIAAQYADLLNTTAGFDEIPRKLAALGQHLDRFGRDRASIHVSPLASLLLGESTADAEAKRDKFLGARGIDWASATDDVRAMMSARMIIGDEAAVIERVQELRAMGLDGLVVNLIADDADLDAVRHAGEVLAKAS
jgi:F420-dependent oxidoreductase-like protein